MSLGICPEIPLVLVMLHKAGTLGCPLCHFSNFSFSYLYIFIHMSYRYMKKIFQLELSTFSAIHSGTNLVGKLQNSCIYLNIYAHMTHINICKFRPCFICDAVMPPSLYKCNLTLYELLNKCSFKKFSLIMSHSVLPIITLIC